MVSQRARTSTCDRSVVSTILPISSSKASAICEQALLGMRRPRHIRDPKHAYEPLLVPAFPACTLS
jgi:hypothetical protein